MVLLRCNLFKLSSFLIFLCISSTICGLWLLQKTLDNSHYIHPSSPHSLTLRDTGLQKTVPELQNNKYTTVKKGEKKRNRDDTCPLFQMMPNNNLSEEVSCRRVDLAPGSCRIMKTIFREKPGDCSHQQTSIICEVKASNPKRAYAFCYHDICKKTSSVSIGLYISDLGWYRWHRLNSTEELETFINSELLMDGNYGYPNNGYCVIQCDTNSGIFASQLLILPPKLQTNSEHSKRSLVNINILLLDSVSRHHFYRSLPKTIKKFRHLNIKHLRRGRVFDFELFQGIKSRTLESLQVLFEGLNIFRLEGHKSIVYLNETFGKFKAYGYKTLYVEDQCWLFEWGLVKEQGAMNLTASFSERVKLFNEAVRRAGIDHLDITYSSCLILQENKVKNNFHGPNSICYNGIHQHTYLLQYMEYFLHRFSTLQRPTFTFMILNTAHEDTGIRIKQMDEDLARHVSFLANHPNTISFILSDHGNTYGNFLSSSAEFFVEIFHPLLFVIVPDNLARILGGTKMKALHVNQRRLVSLLDVHYTLHSFLPAVEEFHRNSTQYNVNSDGLLSPVSPSRNCSDIPRLHPNLCICQGSYKSEKNTSKYSLFAEYALSSINKQIIQKQKSKERSCQTLVATRFSNVKISTDHCVSGSTIILDLFIRSTNMSNYDEERLMVTMFFDFAQSEGILFLGYHRLTPFSIYQPCADPSVGHQICICERYQTLERKTIVTNMVPKSVLWTKTYTTMVHKPCLFLNTRNYTDGVAISMANACLHRTYSIVFSFLSKNLYSSSKMPVKQIVYPVMESLIVVGIRKIENLPWRYKYSVKFKLVNDKEDYREYIW